MVKEGDSFLPVVFNCAVQEIMKKLKQENKGIKINGSCLKNLRFPSKTGKSGKGSGVTNKHQKKRKYCLNIYGSQRRSRSDTPDDLSVLTGFICFTSTGLKWLMNTGVS